MNWVYAMDEGDAILKNNPYKTFSEFELIIINSLSTHLIFINWRCNEAFSKYGMGSPMLRYCSGSFFLWIYSNGTELLPERFEEVFN